MRRACPAPSPLALPPRRLARTRRAAPAFALLLLALAAACSAAPTEPRASRPAPRVSRDMADTSGAGSDTTGRSGGGWIDPDIR